MRCWPRVHRTQVRRLAVAGGRAFGARYYRSNVGGFISPDHPLADQHPQSSLPKWGACIVKWQITVVPILLSALAVIAGAQSTANDMGGAQETQVRGYWIDPSTGLMWVGKDNGRDVSWKHAVRYCRDLRLAGYSDWRLATLAELEGIYDKNANAPGLAGPGKGSADTWHVKGNLFLTGNEWSSERRKDDRGHPSGYEWYFDFNEGRSNNQPSGFPYPSSFMRALCIRGSGK
jgi:hypothetical protein